MGKLDWQDLEFASGRYTRLRRRSRRWHLTFLLTALLAIPLLAAAGALPYPVVRNLLVAAFAIGFLGQWSGTLITWSALTRFACPRCGRRFIMIWWSSWPTDRCKHSGLNLSPSAVARARENGGVELS